MADLRSPATILRSWTFGPGVVLVVVAVGSLYLWGAVVVARRSFGAGRPRASSGASASSSSPAFRSDATAFDTVGALSPLARLSSARDSGPRVCRSRSTCRSLNFPSTAGRMVVTADAARALVGGMNERISRAEQFVKEI